MKRLGWLLLLVLAAADRPQPSSLDQLAAGVATWVADDEPVAVHVVPGAPALAPLADLLEDLVATRTGAGRMTSARAARAAGYHHWVEIDLGADATDLRALGRVHAVGHDLWAEIAGEKPGGTVGTFVVGIKLDAGLRAYLGPPPPSVAVAPPAAAKPRKLAFRPIGSIDLGAPLLDLAAGDLDGDGKAELVALTTDEVLVVVVGADGARVAARAALEGPPPVPRPRAPVGSLVIAAGDGKRTIVARSSAHAAGATFTYAAGALARGGEVRGFPLCADGGRMVAAELVPGLDLLSAGKAEPLPARFLAARCGAGLAAAVDAEGVLRLFKPETRTPLAQVAGCGTAFALADLDGDGVPELVTAGFHAPGAADAFTIYTLAAGAPRILRRGPTTPSGIIAVAAGDLDGDGAPDVVGASRGAGTQVDLWLAD